MKRTVFLVTGIVITALAVAVPSAFGNQRPSVFEHGNGGNSSTQQVDPVQYFYANERATMTLGPVIHDHGDATQAKLLLQSQPTEIIRDHGDATQAKLLFQSQPTELVRDHGDATQAKLAAESAPVVTRESIQRAQEPSTSPIARDHGDAEQAKLAARTSDSPVVESASSSDFNWSQLGIALGVGIFLVGGLILAVQYTRNQRLAH
jgi:hypothetical protein